MSKLSEAVADVLNAKYLGKVAKAMSDLYQIVVVREQEAPTEVVIEVEEEIDFIQIATDLSMQCALTDSIETIAKFLETRLKERIK